MEPIPEEDQEIPSIPPTCTMKHEKKSRLTEVYTSEQVDTRMSKIPHSTASDSWMQVKKDGLSKTNSSAYSSESLIEPASAQSSTYSYTYESHYDELPDETSPTDHVLNKEFCGDIERHSSQMQKITRVTKVTTTRSLRQLPSLSQGAEYFFDADGSPLLVERTTTPSDEHEPDAQDELLSFGIDLRSDDSMPDRHVVDAPPPAPSSVYETEAYASQNVPGAPSVPEITDVTISDIAIIWQPPEIDRQAGLIGYLIEIRELNSAKWCVINEDLIKKTSFRIKNLNPHSKYDVRVVAVNSSGRGMPSVACTGVHLCSDYKFNSDLNGWNGTAPGRPYVILLDTSSVVLEWSPAIPSPGSSPVTGYKVSYRTENSEWTQSNDNLITTCRTEVSNLKPNGDYEFRVVAISADGLSEPSLSSGFVRLKSSALYHYPSLMKAQDACHPPGQPQIEEFDANWVQLHWIEGGPPDEPSTSYIVEYREVGDPLWYTATTAAVTTSYTVKCLRPNSTYEFRVIGRDREGNVSLPSAVSNAVQLRPVRSGFLQGIPAKPQPPEYVDFGNGDRVTLCWFPAASSLPIQGYNVEFRDHQQDAAWYRVNERLIRSCKMTVGDLIPGHHYQFRVIACNAVGYSLPSDPSPVVHIAVSYNGGGDAFVETATYGTVPLLQDEIVRESPPLPDRDDSPPPIHRKFLREKDGLHWRDPTLKEVIEYLDSTNKVEQLNASGYLQHLTFNDNAIKEETRELGGIPKLVRLLSGDVPDIQKNVCGCLKNLSFGKENDENKRAINDAGGIAALAALLRQTHDVHVMEEVTATLWNLSSCDDLKSSILDQVSEPINQRVVVPGSRLIGNDMENGLNVSYNVNMFKNGTGVLRNVSAASSNARKILRGCPGLIESLVYYLRQAVLRNQVDTRTVENVVCTLRNLSYRIQEVVDENYDPKVDFETSQRERSKSAPSGSPKVKKKESNKKSKMRQNSVMNESKNGAEYLWQPELVKLYLKLLQEASNPEVLEASAGAIQNLVACQFEPSINVRACVRIEKGLPVLVELLRLNDDKVVCAVTTALRNLSLDQRNRELIGKYAMKDLVAKLPRAEQRYRDPNVSDATIGAVLGIFFEIIKHSSDFTRNIHECGGTERLRNLASSHPTYSFRICKYASQVLYLMWQHKELHDGFKRNGLKESDFYSGTTSRVRDATTLSRPISSQGAERPTHGTNENPESSTNSLCIGKYDTLDSRAYEPLYASVHKRTDRYGLVGGDSWV